MKATNRQSNGADLLAVLMSIFLTTTAAPALAQDKCERIFKMASVSSETSTLMELGFQVEIAQRIATDRPELADQLSRLPKQKAHAITLYRGFDRPANEITLNLQYWRSQSIWFSLSRTTAESFAGGHRDKSGTVLEVQVPKSFFSSGFDPSLDPVELVKRGFTDGTINRYDIPSLHPFITRVGVVTPGTPPRVKWVTYEEAIRTGLID